MPPSIVDHPIPVSKRGEWRFLARFKDSGPEDDASLDPMAQATLARPTTPPGGPAFKLKLDRHSKEPSPDLNIPDNQRHPADRRQYAPGGRGFLSSKKRQCNGGTGSTKWLLI